MKEITYISLFSGIGGFELGLENSKHNFKCLGYSEIDKYAKSIYTRHFPKHKDFGDATKIKTENLPDFDFLVGGFPCQAFSYAGKRRGFDDTRGTLFFEIARILKDKRPKYFLLENVKGLLSHEKGETFQTILEILSNLGYYVQWEVLNSADFGVPQRRERVFIKGYSRNGSSGKVLSFRRIYKENSGKISNTYGGTRQGRVHYPDEHMNTLGVSGHNGGSTQLIVEEAPERKCIVQQIKKPVVKRKYDADLSELQELLRSHKKKQELSNKDISELLGLPETHIAHWFRTDEYFSIPDAENWFDLKEVLRITVDDFDKFITEFEVVDGKYDMGNRVYSSEGLSFALKSSNPELICINPDKAQAQKVYDINGLATCLSANGGRQGGKTGLYKVPVSDEVIEENFSKVDESRRVTTSEEGNCFSVPTKFRQRNVKKKIDNYVLEENVREIKKVGTTNGHQSGNVYDSDGLAPTLTCCDWKSPVKIIEDNVEEVIGSTQKHAARTDGTYSPTLTEAMGKGGEHIPMLKIRETTKKGYKEAYPDDGVLLDRAGRKIAKGLVHKGATGTLKTQPAWGTVTQDYRIRKLTPKECERLQAFPDDWTRFGVNGEEISDTQRYKCCGNAVTTSVITAIVNDMFDEIYEEK